MYKGSKACRVYRWVGHEVHSFPTSSCGDVPWQTFQPRSQSVAFLSLELGIAVVALLIKLTCDQSTQSIVLCLGHWYLLDFFQLEKEGPVHQFDSTFQDTMKLLMLIGNAVVDIRLFISLEGQLLHIGFLRFFEVIWLAPSLLSHFNRLGDFKQTQ